MSGIYLHVPFCRTACHYCDFHFSTSMKNMDSFVDAVIREIQIRSGQAPWHSSLFRTLYFGGGTPSVLSVDQAQRIVSAIGSCLNNEGSWAESTIEVNPEDVSKESLRGWRKCGFNRISIGVQSFDDDQLNWMNRKHSAAEAIEAIWLAKSEGFEKVSIDLIYGIPHRSEKSWTDTIEKAFYLPIDHISCYALTIEPKTVLGARVKKDIEKAAPDKLIENDYSELCLMAQHNGFIHYEVSNWARSEENKAIHNTSYWEGVPYLGLGAGAHGFDGNRRYSLVSNNYKYISSIESRVLPEKFEELTALDRSNEMLMTGLRTSNGVDFEELKQLWGVDHILDNASAWKRWVEAGAIIPVDENRYRISERCWLIGDSISADLISI
ncbi:MAG: coproporphyrinogen III oxidase [Crocinitomicaceae bacterium]|nr:coproporphyrinogen III oxidase [Crocinitomicaceae bacterium]